MKSVLSAWLELDLPRHKTEFYRMWHLGHKSGLPPDTMLRQMGNFDRSRTVERIRETLLAGAVKRKTIRETIESAPNLFEQFELSLITLGEESGQLEEISIFLADYFAAEARAVQTVKRRLAYPMINVIAAIFIVSFPVLFFGDVTKYFVTVTAELAVALFFGGAILSRVAARHRNRPKFVIGRFCRALAMGIEAGLSLDKVAEMAVTVAAQPQLASFMKRIPEAKRRSMPLAELFNGAPGLPIEVIRSLAVADETGNYRDTMVKLADLYDGGYGRV